LPNIRNYSPESWRNDFGTPVEGWEAPWQRAQFVLAYDTARTPDPPRTIPALGEWIDAHPGRFTYIAPPDFTGSAFLRHVLFHFGGGAEPFREGFDEQLYRAAARKTFAWLNERERSLWRRGETYPATLRELNRLFANSEVDFAMSYGPSFASEAIERGEFPPTTRTLVFDTGTIANYNFLAIAFNAGNVAGALVAINHLLSFEAALDAMRELRTAFPLDLSRLAPEQRDAVSALPRGIATLPGDVLATHSLPEADARYLELFERDWRTEVLLR
jgi:putative spermidine/putrescine transport system substrate-binding protein